MTFPQALCDGRYTIVLFQEQMAEQAAHFWVSQHLPFPARRDVSSAGFMHRFASIILHWKGQMYDFDFPGPRVEDNSPPVSLPALCWGGGDGPPVIRWATTSSNLNVQICFPKCTSWHSCTVHVLCPWPLLHVNYKSFSTYFLEVWRSQTTLSLWAIQVWSVFKYRSIAKV